MERSSCSCSCGTSTNLLYACSGSANTGYLADAVTRTLAANNVGKMTCLAAVGAELSGFVESAKSADRNIILDGCPVACGKKTFERLGLPYEQYRMGTSKNRYSRSEERFFPVFRPARDFGNSFFEVSP